MTSNEISWLFFIIRFIFFEKRINKHLVGYLFIKISQAFDTCRAVKQLLL